MSRTSENDLSCAALSGTGAFLTGPAELEGDNKSNVPAPTARTAARSLKAGEADLIATSRRRSKERIAGCGLVYTARKEDKPLPSDAPVGLAPTERCGVWHGVAAGGTLTPWFRYSTPRASRGVGVRTLRNPEKAAGMLFRILSKRCPSE